MNTHALVLALGSTAIVKLPNADNWIKLYHLMGKAPGMVTEGVAADYASWGLRDERIEILDGGRHHGATRHGATADKHYSAVCAAICAPGEHIFGQGRHMASALSRTMS